jgi:hypothetical protein
MKKGYKNAVKEHTEGQVKRNTAKELAEGQVDRNTAKEHAEGQVDRYMNIDEDTRRWTGRQECR